MFQSRVSFPSNALLEWRQQVAKNDPNRFIHCVFQMSVQANISVIRYVVFGIIPICLSRQKERYPA